MSVTETSSTAERIQAWVPSSLAEQLRAQADLERRSISQTIRIAVEDRLRKTTSPTTGEARRRPDVHPRSTGAASDASSEGGRR